MVSEQETFKTPEQCRKRLFKERQTRYRKRQKNDNIERTARVRQHSEIVRHKLERIDQICSHCNAKFWIDERDCNSSQRSPTFAICYADGKVHLPPLLKSLSYLIDLYTLSEPNINSFCKNIRGYNSVLACTSLGANVNKEFQRQDVSNF